MTWNAFWQWLHNRSAAADSGSVPDFGVGDNPETADWLRKVKSAPVGDSLDPAWGSARDVAPGGELEDKLTKATSQFQETLAQAVGADWMKEIRAAQATCDDESAGLSDSAWLCRVTGEFPKVVLS